MIKTIANLHRIFSCLSITGPRRQSVIWNHGNDYLRLASAPQRRLASTTTELIDILRSVKLGQLSVEEASDQIQAPRSDEGSNNNLLHSFANLDHHRSRRTGFPEVVFAEGKTAEQVASILDEMARIQNELSASEQTHSAHSSAILATRVSMHMYEDLKKLRMNHGTIQYFREARVVALKPVVSVNAKQQSPRKLRKGRVVVATAGTTDIPVAEEAAVILEAAECVVDRVFDVGVAGLHRIIGALPRLRHPDVGCIIVCAGMDGALPSVVGGLVRCPVFSVPTSTGYGTSFNGVSALLTALNSCSPGVGVVNIDNGFGAAALAFKCIQIGQDDEDS